MPLDHFNYYYYYYFNLDFLSFLEHFWNSRTFLIETFSALSWQS